MCQIEGVPWLDLPASMLLEPREVRSHTLADLVRRTVSRTKRAARNCTSREVASDPNRLIWAYRTSCGEDYSDPNGHVSHIKVKLGEHGQDRSTVSGVPLKDLHVAVRCSCPAFLYWVSQWIAHNNGFLAGKPRPLLLAPQVRFRFKDGASTKRSLVCKHIVSAARQWITQAPPS